MFSDAKMNSDERLLFITGPPLPCTRCQGKRVPSSFRPAICMRQKHPSNESSSASFPWRRRIATALAIASSMIGGVLPAAASNSARQESPAMSKELRYDGRQELGGTEKAMSLVLTGGTFAALSVWAWKKNREEDDLEQIRIKEEVERLEKLKAEFLDVEEDDDSLDDEDLLAELSKRISKDAEEGNESGDSPDGADPSDSSSSLDDPSSSSADRETATMERPGSPTQDGSQSGPGSESVDMLRRMWEATDDESKDDKPETEQ